MFALIANLLIRSSLILGSAALLCRLCQSLLPKQRHAILLAAFGLLFLWPLLAAVLPEVNIPFALHRAATEGVTVQQFIASRRVAPSTHGFFVLPAILWAGIAFTTLTPLALAQLRLRIMVGLARKCEDADWQALLNQLSVELGIAETPALLIHPDSIMPMVSGVLHPRIILPADCHSWELSVVASFFCMNWHTSCAKILYLSFSPASSRPHGGFSPSLGEASTSCAAKVNAHAMH